MSVARVERPTMHAPSAMGGDLGRFWNLTVTLAATEFKLRYFGSALGYLWSLMRPLLFFGVLYVVFTKVIRFGAGIEFYPVYLLTSIVFWTFFTEACGASVTCLTDREALLRKIRFPRMVIPLSVSLTALFNLAMNMIAVLIFAFASGVEPHWTWLEMPFLIALLVIFACGIGMMLSALYVRFRDVAPIWEVTAQILFYASPVLYVSAQYKQFETVALMNPIAAILTQMRHAFIDNSAPSLSTAMGSPALVAIPLAVIAVVFAAGLWTFNREAPRIAENL